MVRTRYQLVLNHNLEPIFIHKLVGNLLHLFPEMKSLGGERDFLREGWINPIQNIAFIYFPCCVYTSEEVRKLQTPQLGARKATEFSSFSLCRYNQN